MPRHHALAVDLVAELAERSVQLRVEHGRLRCIGAPGVLTEELLDQVRGLKAELVRHLTAGGVVATAPLSYPQQRLWLHDRLNPGDTAYHIPLAVDLRGPLRLAGLRTALSTVAHRHEVLRTVYPVRDGVPTAQVLAPAMMPLPIVDLTALPGGIRDGVADALAEAEARRPFDLATGPVARAALLRLSTGVHRLLLTRHHIASDGWSFGVLTDEVSHAYRAAVRGVPPRLPALRWCYSDFARWQRRSEEADSVPGAARRRWRDRLTGASWTVSFVDATRTDRCGDVQVTSRTLTSEVAVRVRQVAHAIGATPFTLLVTALGIAAAAIAGQRDLVFGTPVSGRLRPETEALIGSFATVVPLRVRSDPHQTFRDAVKQTHETVAQALDDQHVPVERILGETPGGPRRDGARTAFAIVFAFQNTPTPAITLADLSVRVHPSPPLAPKYPLTITASEADGLTLFAEYDADAVPWHRVTELLDRMVALVHSGSMDPRRTCGEFEDPAATVGATLASRFEAVVARRPDAIAVTDDEGHVSYGALARKARRVAAALRAAGVGPEDRVGVHLGHGAPLVAAIVGIVLAGAAYVPLDPDDPPARHESLLADAGVRVLVTAHSWLDAFAWYEGPVVVVDRLAEAMSQSISRPISPAVRSAPRSHPDHLAYVIYTSGSTGAPKGVMVSQRSVLSLFAAAAPEFGFTAEDVWTMTHSAAFDFSVWELWGALLHGARVVVVARPVVRDADALWRLLVRERVTVHSATPTALDALTASARNELATGRTALRAVVLGGERCEPARTASWITALDGRRPGVVNMYGITETTVHVTSRRLAFADVSTAGSPIGQPLPGVAAYAVNARRERVQAGVGGELLVGGPGLGRGYLGRPGLTADRFRPDHFGGDVGGRLYTSGDLVVAAVEGSLHYVGRLDRQLKIRGYRIEPGEVTAVLARHPALAGAAVAAETINGRTVLSAYVVADDGHRAPTAPDLLRYLWERLPSYMVPARFTVVSHLPRNRSGKLDHEALAAAAVRADSEAKPAQAPHTPTEKAVADLWAELLGVPDVGRHDDFFTLGGDSLLLSRMHARLTALIGFDVPIRRVYQAFDVASLAAAIDELRTSPDSIPRGAP